MLDDSPDLDDPAALWPVPDPTAPGTGESPAIGSPPARWVLAAMEPAERRARMRELAVWVEWLIDTHALHNVITPCWYRHPPVREHLVALYAGWVRIYCVPDDNTGRDLGEADWLSTLHNFLPYLQVATCASGRHQDPPPRPPVREGADEDFSEYLWTSDFGTQPAQHPAADAALRQVPVEEPL